MEYEAENRKCRNCKEGFVIDPEDFGFYEKLKVPPPAWCPKCRLQRKMLWHNERYLFRVKSARTGKEIFSMYPSQADLVVWERDLWLGDDWDQNGTGMDYNWTRPFFDQLRELISKAPIPNKGAVQLIDSEYSNNSSYLKNCYLVFGTTNGENCSYLENSTRIKDSMDCTLMSDSELCYESFFDSRCYQALYSAYCEDCRNIYFCRDCTGCSDCFGCVNLRGKSYYIFNKPYTKEEYGKELAKMGLSSYSSRETAKKKVEEFWQGYPVRYAKNYKNSDCTGEYITNSKNVHKSYYVDGSENAKYCHGLYAKPTKDAYDQYRYGDTSELMYECALTGGHSVNGKFSYHVYTNCREFEYSWNCNRSAHIFGCIGLHGKEYCILNKQYSKEEYEDLIPKIRKHMNEMPYADRQGGSYGYGEFLPPDLSPVAYNQSVAQEYFPLSESDALRAGYRWWPIERKNFLPTLAENRIPDEISKTEESILSEIIECKNSSRTGEYPECTKVFKLIPSELQFYEKMNIPLPHLCPNCRWSERIKQRNSVLQRTRSCQCSGRESENRKYKNQSPHFHGPGPCPNEFQTSYAPDGMEIVYCEQCYNSEIA